MSSEQALAGVRWRRLTWRAGTKRPLTARFAVVRVVVADGAQGASGQHLPGDAAWLVGEWRDTGERKYYLTNHAERTPLRVLAAAIKARWSCEQAHQQLQWAADPPAAHVNVAKQCYSWTRNHWRRVRKEPGPE